MSMSSPLNVYRTQDRFTGRAQKNVTHSSWSQKFSLLMSAGESPLVLFHVGHEFVVISWVTSWGIMSQSDPQIRGGLFQISWSRFTIQLFQLISCDPSWHNFISLLSGGNGGFQWRNTISWVIPSSSTFHSVWSFLLVISVIALILKSESLFFSFPSPRNYEQTWFRRIKHDMSVI